MKTLHQILYTTLLALLAVGCQSNNGFSDSDFGDVISLSGESHNLDTSLSIKDIWAVNDSLIIAHTDGGRDSIFVIINPREWSVISALKDLKRDAKLIKSRKEIMIYDPIPGRVATYSSQGELQGKIWNLPSEDIAQNLLHDGVSYVYENYDQSLSKRLVYLNRDNRTEITDFAEVLKTTRNSAIYQGFAGINSNAQRVVYAYKYLRRVEIYTNSGERVSVRIDPSAPMPNIINKDMQISSSTLHYNGLFATPERIYLHYIGAPQSSLPPRTFVEEWDWDGNPIKRYELDGYHRYFTYVNGYFVGEANGKESALVTYKIE